MTKKYYLLSCLILLSIVSFSQHSRIPLNEAPMRLAPLSEEELKYSLTHTKVNKAPGDTLFYEDFSGGFSTNGWTSVDTTQNGFDWIYTTAAPGGQYSTTIPALNSVTAANGFASLPSDFYNTPSPVSGFSRMGSFLTSGPIVINHVGSVLLKWRQWLRFCCSSSDVLEVQVSSDNLSWVTFDAKFGRSASTNVPNEDVEIDISAVAAGQDTIYLRFFQNATHYFWMIDDITIVEGSYNRLEILGAFSQFGSSSNEGYYTIIPLALTQPLRFQLEVQNKGAFNATNVGFTNSIEHNLQGIVYTDSSVKTPLIRSPLGIEMLKITTPFSNTSLVGHYKATLEVTSDSINEVPSGATSIYSWAITDTVFAKDYNLSQGNIGPWSYVGGDTDGSRIGTKFTLASAQTVTSLTYYISSSTASIGAKMRAQVWGFDTSQATLNDMVNVPGIKAQSQGIRTIQQSDLGSWITIPINPAVTLPAGQYILAAEQTSGNLNGNYLSFGRDRTAEEVQPFGLDFVSLVYSNGAGSTWGNIFTQPMMRMNFGLLVGVEEAAKAIEGFTVSPNPNNGQFNVEVTAEIANFDLSVRNMVGQVVYNEAITVNNVLRKNIDLSNLNKGIYLVSIENGVNRKVQKVILK